MLYRLLLKRVVILFLLILLFINISLPAQTPAINEQWWSDLVGWDGVSHWSEYQTHSSAFLGANALPIPAMSDGKVNNTSALTTAGQFHFSDGDNTQNIALYLNYNFLKDVISVDLLFIPIEFFQMSHTIKEQRKVFYKYYDVSNTTGDVYVNTNFKVFTQEKNKIDMAIRIGLKTASGGNSNPARFTDTHGYYFDASFGKAVGIDKIFRPYAMLGFYSWETNDDRLPQNDAVMYGIGFEYLKNRTSFKNELTGYNGYKKNGDKPSVYRLTLSKSFSRLILGAKYQHGLRDYNYKTFELSLGYKFKENKSE